jgi:hypothetical protein
MRPHLIYIFLIFSFSNLFAQIQNKKIVLNWTTSINTETINYRAKTFNSKQNKTIIVKNNYFDSNFVPTFQKKWLVNINQEVSELKITDVVYKTISADLLHPKSLKYIPNKLNPSLKIFNARDKSYATFTLNPIIKINNIFKKVVLFTISYQLRNKNSFSRNTNNMQDSPLATGSWYKFAVDTTGVFKLSKSFLNSLGININNINPKHIKIYGNGGNMLPEKNNIFRYTNLQENAIYIKGEDDNSFDNNDYILFYAQGPVGWNYNSANTSYEHQQNIYSNRAYYFITVDDTPGKRIEDATTINGNFQIIDKYDTYLVHEIDKFNFDNFGQDFFGESFQINNSQTFSFDIQDLDITKPVKVKFRVGASASNTTNFTFSYNNQEIALVNISGTSNTAIARINYTQSTFTPTSEQLQFKINYNNNGNPSARSYLDYIEINAIKKLIARNKQFNFRSSLVNTQNSTFKFSIENASNIYKIWDVTDIINVKNILNNSTSTNFEFNVEGGTEKEYVLVNESDFYTPILLQDRRVDNQNIHSLRDIEYLIISHPSLTGQANRLAEYHQNNGLSTYVITPQIIYNEFSSGSQDLTAIRDFIKYLYDNASSNDKKIKYVLFLGDSSFDFKNIMQNNGNATNVFAYQSANSYDLANSYVTDDYFCMMDTNEGDFRNNNGDGNLIDVFVGRLPVKNYNEAKNAIDKILTFYSTESIGKWRSKIAIIADDIDRKQTNFNLEKNSERIADSIKAHKPEYNLIKLYTDAYQQVITTGGERYPKINEEIDNAVENGSLLINYFGHGGENGWASERILNIDQINSWHNPKTSPLFITVTCEFSRYDNPERTTAGEYVFNNPNGGSIDMITTSREVYIYSGALFNRKLITNILEFDSIHNYTISEALAVTKNDNSSYIQRLFINYFGDPAMKLPISKPKIKLTEMNNTPINQSLDTIKALSHNSFKGIITDENDNLLSNYNGELYVEVFDKSVTLQTLNNDDSYFNNIPAIMEFDTRQSKIFNGKVSIVNGQWEFDFIAPRDIRIAYGNSKISFYGHNHETDKMGYNTDIIIGGINPNAPTDTVGPKIKLFMNDESFIDGGNTNQSPIFLALLEDESGINTSTTAVDHDIIAILDGDVSNPIIMNNYYETELDDFTKGKVKYPFRNLSVGHHTITFKCWDTYNNMSEATINFVVVSDTDLVLDNVLNYPNPFINYTEFWFNHNKPNEALEVQVQIFTISGKLIKTLNKNVLTNGTLSRSITWNGLDDFGNKIGKGVYVYKLSVKVNSSNIHEEKFEKLVILQ